MLAGHAEPAIDRGGTLGRKRAVECDGHEALLNVVEQDPHVTIFRVERRRACLDDFLEADDVVEEA
ncbi:MAG: hypothetical protein ABI183_17080, partial [Polyangiaceae bacterium]